MLFHVEPGTTLQNPKSYLCWSRSTGSLGYKVVYVRCDSNQALLDEWAARIETGSDSLSRTTTSKTRAIDTDYDYPENEQKY